MILNCSSFKFVVFFSNFFSVGVGALSGGIAAYISCPMEVATGRFPHEDLISQNVAWIESNE